MGIEDQDVLTVIGSHLDERNRGKMLTLAVVDKESARPGTEVTLLWGESDGGTAKPTVEPHVQMEMRAIVSPVPYAKVAREKYRAD